MVIQRRGYDPREDIIRCTNYSSQEEEEEGEHSVIPLTGKNSRKPEGELHALFLSCCHETHAVPPRADVRRLSYWFRSAQTFTVEVLGLESFKGFKKKIPFSWMGAGWVPGPGAASSSEWGLMETNDLGRLKGRDQGRGTPPAPLNFQCGRLMRAQNSHVSVSFTPRGLLNLVSGGALPTCWRPYDTQPAGATRFPALTRGCYTVMTWPKTS